MTTYTSQPDGASGMDAYINSLSPTTNDGGGNLLYVGDSGTSTTRGLIKFDLSSIPAGATCLSANLYMTIYGDLATNARTLRVYRTKRDWVEAQVTWNIWKTSNSWSAAGGFHANDCEQTDCGSLALSASESGEKTIPLTAALIAEMWNGTFTNNGWLLKMDTEVEDAYQWYSSDWATANQRPKLVIEYVLGGQVILWESD